MNVKRTALSCLLVFFLLPFVVRAQDQVAGPKRKPRVVILGVNGMELDIIRPLILKGQMPNLAKVIEKAPTANCGQYRRRTVPVFTQPCLPARIRKNTESRASSSEESPLTPIC